MVHHFRQTARGQPALPCRLDSILGIKINGLNYADQGGVLFGKAEQGIALRIPVLAGPVF